MTRKNFLQGRLSLISTIAAFAFAAAAQPARAADDDAAVLSLVRQHVAA